MLWKKLIERKVRTDSLWRGLAERRQWWVLQLYTIYDLADFLSLHKLQDTVSFQAKTREEPSSAHFLQESISENNPRHREHREQLATRQTYITTNQLQIGEQQRRLLSTIRRSEDRVRS